MGKIYQKARSMRLHTIAASFSSAWSKGFGSQDVYWVHPEQVSKTPQSGEFVTKGAFIIRGSRNYVRGVPLLIAVGIVDYEGERIMAGPPKALEKYTDTYVIIKPGYTKKEEISRANLKKNRITEHILTLDDVIGVLPSGKCDFIDERDLKNLKYIKTNLKKSTLYGLFFSLNFFFNKKFMSIKYFPSSSDIIMESSSMSDDRFTS
jgi:hypothetical protein